MTNREACVVLERLLEGVHPVTGEIFPDDHVCGDPLVLRALYKGICALRGGEKEEAPRSRKSRANNKLPWTAEEDAYLRTACAQGAGIEQISSQLQRSERNVKYRMVFLDLADRSILEGRPYPNTRHAHQGLPWYPEAEKRLKELYLSGKTPKELSTEMKRSMSSILARLEKLGLIEDRNRH